MNNRRNPRCNAEAESLREAVINHAYRENMPNSVVEGLRHVSDLWLLSRRDNSMDDIMRDVKSLRNDPDIARITNDLRLSSEEDVVETGPTLREIASKPQTDWMMV